MPVTNWTAAHSAPIIISGLSSVPQLQRDDGFLLGALAFDCNLVCQGYAQALLTPIGREQDLLPSGCRAAETMTDVETHREAVSDAHERAPGERVLMRDRCGTLRDRWYVACTAEELTRKKPLGRVILEEALVLWRDAAGRARCFRDRCLHRNAKLSEGDLEDGCLRCPYHGWTYDETGRCIRIPSEGPEGIPPRKPIASFPVLEQDDLVWVWMGDPDEAHGTPFRMPHRNEPGWQTYYMVTDFENDVTNCAENFMDVPHTVFVHAGWFRSRTRKKIKATVERTEDSVLVTYEQPNDSIGFSRLILNPTGEPMVHTDKFYMPNVTRVDYDFGPRRGFVITSQCTPVSDLQCRVYTLISFRLGSRILDAIGRWLLPPYTRQVIWQDVVIMKNQGESLRRYGREFMHSPADVLHRYIESLRAWAEGGEQGPRPRPAKTEIEFWV